MSDSADSRPGSDANSKAIRLFWAPAILGLVPWLVWLATRTFGGLDGVASLSGANPNQTLEWIGGVYLASWFATVALTPSMIIASIVLWGWEWAWEARKRSR